jgi:protein-S-isoprenylcysteine O-methyltransferase Ste14
VGELTLMARTGGRDTRDATTTLLTLTVMAGLAAAVVAAYEADGLAIGGPEWWPEVAGAALLAAGYALRVWSVRTLGRFFKYRVVVQEGHEVVETGPYAVLRHPSYTGMVLCSAGLGLMLGNWLSVALAALPTLAGFTVRLLSEERVLAAEIGDPYREYMTRTRRLVPGVW